MISGDGVKFERFQFGYKDSDTEPGLQHTLKPDDSWSYHVRLLYSRVPPGRLAFEKPGKYFVRTGDQSPTANNWHAQSNVLVVTILEPKGADAQVWQRMQDKKMYSLLQSGNCSNDATVALIAAQGRDPLPADKDTVAQAVALLREFPKSSYRDALSWALRNVYFREGSEAPTKLREDIRATLGFIDAAQLKEPGVNNFVFGLRKEMLVADLLPLLSKFGGVPLDATAELKKKRIRLTAVEQTARTVMQSLSTQFHAGWWPHGEGYLLSEERPAPRK